MGRPFVGHEHPQLLASIQSHSCGGAGAWGSFVGTQLSLKMFPGEICMKAPLRVTSQYFSCSSFSCVDPEFQSSQVRHRQNKYLLGTSKEIRRFCFFFKLVPHFESQGNPSLQPPGRSLLKSLCPGLGHVSFLSQSLAGRGLHHCPWLSRIQLSLMETGPPQVRGFQGNRVHSLMAAAAKWHWEMRGCREG